MKKLIILFLSLLISNSFSYAYQNFDGMYSYNEYGEGKHISTSFADTNTEVLFIVDFSGSMNKRLGYAPKAFLAIDAIRAILRDTGQTTKIGLRIFGITDRRKEANDCKCIFADRRCQSTTSSNNTAVL